MNAQVKDVSYKLQYDVETCLFDCFLVVNEGEAVSTRDRIQFNAQVSVVVPAGSTVYVDQSHMPLVDNQNRTGTVSTEWEVTSFVESPQAMSDSDVYGITPYLSPTALYNDILEGEEVKLFSLKISNISNCGTDIRLFDNTNDPTSTNPGMRGTDFRNGFTMGGIDQLYSTNLETVLPSSPIIEDVKVSFTNGFALDVISSQPNASACQEAITYSIYEPNGSLIEYSAIAGKSYKDLKDGLYTVVATDGLGCSAQTAFSAKGLVNNEGQTGLGNNPQEEVVNVNHKFESSVFPNPSYGDVTLTVSGREGANVNVDIVDLDGQILKGNVFSTVLGATVEEVKINADLNPGIYTVAIKVDNAIKNHKLIIIK